MTLSDDLRQVTSRHICAADLVKSVTVRALEGNRQEFSHKYNYSMGLRRLGTTQVVHMPRKNTKLGVAERRTAEARQIVARQQELIAKLKALGQPTVEAELTLQTYVSALKLIEAHEDKVRAEVRAGKHETKRDRRLRTRTPPDSD